MFFDSIAYAMGAPAGGAEGGGSALMSFMPLILMFAIFYFLLIRPQQKKAKMHREFLAGLKKGDFVLTGGGIYGRITETDGDVLTIEIGEGLSIKINRNFVSGPADVADLKGKK